MDGIDTGTQFNFTYAPGVSLDQMMGFEMAGEFWSQHLADDVSINIFVEMTDYLPENVIGGALPGIEDNVRYADYRQKLEQDITSDIDTLIDKKQQNRTDKFTAYFSSDRGEDGYKVNRNEYMKMTRANAKALDLIAPHDPGLDGYVLMRDLDGVGDGDLNDIRWSYDYEGDFVDSNSLDFLSVAIHEIGHTMGFISGLDEANWLAEKLNYKKSKEDDYYSSLKGTLNNATPVDMMRFSKASYDFSDGRNWIDMSIGGKPFLSFSGSRGKPVAYFATGGNTGLGGDGDQASHWKRQDDVLGIMDPVLATGQRREITELDLQLFDAIGWDLKTGNETIETIHTQAKAELADRMGVTVEWMEINPVEAAEILTPDYIDLDNNNYDDRGERLHEMVVESGEVYEWGWQGYWWGWQGYWWGWQGYWQSTEDLTQDGFWQNFSRQTLEVSDNSQPTTIVESDNPSIFVESNILPTEFNVASTLGDRNYFELASESTTQDESDEEDNQPEAEVTLRQPIVNGEMVVSEFTTKDLDSLGRLLSQRLEDILNMDEELYVMPIK